MLLVDLVGRRVCLLISRIVLLHGFEQLVAVKLDESREVICRREDRRDERLLLFREAQSEARERDFEKLSRLRGAERAHGVRLQMREDAVLAQRLLVEAHDIPQAGDDELEALLSDGLDVFELFEGAVIDRLAVLDEGVGLVDEQKQIGNPLARFIEAQADGARQFRPIARLKICREDLAVGELARYAQRRLLDIAALDIDYQGAAAVTHAVDRVLRHAQER